MTLSELRELYSTAREIAQSGLSWGAKYDLIFSDEVSGKIKLDYRDPDLTYEEDVSAFMDAFDEYMGKKPGYWKVEAQDILREI